MDTGREGKGSGERGQLFGPGHPLGKVKVLVTQLSPILCDPHGLWPARILGPGNSLGKNTGKGSHGVGSHALFQGIFPTQGFNSGLLNCRKNLYHPSH